jgi:hypothetical protein
MQNLQIVNIEVQCNVFEGANLSNWNFSHENGAFFLKIAEGRAMFLFKYPLAAMEEAERLVAEFIGSWEGDMLLQTGPVRRRFQTTGCRAPGRGGYVHVSGLIRFAGDLVEATIRQKAPWRIPRYREIAIVSALIQRYEDYRSGRERLSVLGYFCISALQHAFNGDRKVLAEKLEIEVAVLNALGRLVSTVGSFGSARKINRESELRDFSPNEEYWLESVSRELIERAGEVFSGRRAGAKLTMHDLPSL